MAYDVAVTVRATTAVLALGCAALASCAGFLELSRYDSLESDGGAGGTTATAGAGGVGDGGAGGIGGTAGPGGMGASCFDALSGCACPVAGSVCEEALGGEWVGPVALYGGLADDAPACDDVHASGASTLDGVSCPNCSCGASTLSCNAVATIHADNLCGDVGGTVVFSQINACLALASVTNGDRIETSINESGACPPVGQASVDGNGFALACRADTAACAPRGCFPLPKAGYSKRICFAHPGDVPCPQAFPSKHTIFDANDSCTACGCAPAVGADCNLQVYDAPPCGGNLLQTVLSSNACQDLNPATAGGRLVAASAGTCAPSGGAPITTAGPAYSICCAPAP